MGWTLCFKQNEISWLEVRRLVSLEILSILSFLETFDSCLDMDDSNSKIERKPSIIILDFGSQYSELIARRIRETEVYSMVLGYTTTAKQLQELDPQGIILSGGPSSVYDKGAPSPEPAIWELGIPVLGVCYGMQVMVQQLGGVVGSAIGKAEYGKAPLEVDDPTALLTNVENGSTMWMSHGDSVQKLPENFVRLAHKANNLDAAIKF